MPNSMKAYQVIAPGPPESLVLRELPRPRPKPGWILIKVKAFGLNRAEMFTRQGHSGGAVVFPRILGIECVGEVVSAPGGELSPGQKVCALMGGMGRDFDGSYAEYTIVPEAHVAPLSTDLPWEKLAAIPETFLTAWGSCVEILRVCKGDNVLIRGGTSSVGLAAITICKKLSARVLATTRKQDKQSLLKECGADVSLLDNGTISTTLRDQVPEGVDHVLELIGVKTLRDSLQCAKLGGTVCNTGILGNQWVFSDFQPMVDIPHGVKLTSFNSGESKARDAAATLQEAVNEVESGSYRLNLHKVFPFSDLHKAHQLMDSGSARGKIVVLVD